MTNEELRRYTFRLKGRKQRLEKLLEANKNDKESKKQLEATINEAKTIYEMLKKEPKSKKDDEELLKKEEYNEFLKTLKERKETKAKRDKVKEELLKKEQKKAEPTKEDKLLEDKLKLYSDELNKLSYFDLTEKYEKLKKDFNKDLKNLKPYQLLFGQKLLIILEEIIAKKKKEIELMDKENQEGREEQDNQLTDALEFVGNYNSNEEPLDYVRTLLGVKLYFIYILQKHTNDCISLNKNKKGSERSIGFLYKQNYI
jgi:hypothetical protein